MRLNVKNNVIGATLPDSTAVVVLDTEITPELEMEGLANDALRFIQDTRKTVGLDVSDRIKLFVSGDDKIIESLKQHQTRIMKDVLATEMVYSNSEFENKTEIEGKQISVQIEKV
jgi:isoleucyl-tRNA synthetase